MHTAYPSIQSVQSSSSSSSSLPMSAENLFFLKWQNPLQKPSVAGDLLMKNHWKNLTISAKASMRPQAFPSSPSSQIFPPPGLAEKKSAQFFVVPFFKNYPVIFRILGFFRSSFSRKKHEKPLAPNSLPQCHGAMAFFGSAALAGLALETSALGKWSNKASVVSENKGDV